MNAQRNTALAVLTVLLACIAATDASAQGYTFPHDSQGWRAMGLYDDGGLNPIPGFVIHDNPQMEFPGDGGVLWCGLEGQFPVSPSGADWVHGDLNSPALNYAAGRSFELSYDITGARMASTGTVWVQAVIVVRLPGELSTRSYHNVAQPVPLGEDGAWDRHRVVMRFPAGTIVRKINLRIFFESGFHYNGWVLVDNVNLK